MMDFDRLGRSTLWRCSFKLSRALIGAYPAQETSARELGREIGTLAGQAVFALNDFDRRVYLEDILAHARRIEEMLHDYDGVIPLVRVWFRLGKLREEVFFELERSAAEAGAVEGVTFARTA